MTTTNHGTLLYPLNVSRERSRRRLVCSTIVVAHSEEFGSYKGIEREKMML